MWPGARWPTQSLSQHLLCWKWCDNSTALVTQWFRAMRGQQVGLFIPNPSLCHVVSGCFPGEWAEQCPYPIDHVLGHVICLPHGIWVDDMRSALKNAPMGCLGSGPFGTGTRKASSQHLRSLGWRHVDLNLTWNLMQRYATSPADPQVRKLWITFWWPSRTARLFVMQLCWVTCPSPNQSPRLDRIKQVSGLSPQQLIPGAEGRIPDF